MKAKTVFLIFAVSLSSSLFAQTTGDPWIKKVYNDTWGRDPVGIEWNINNYVNGSWKNYAELMKGVYEWRKNMADQKITFQVSAKQAGGNAILGIYQNNSQIAVDLINVKTGNIVASGGGNIVASGGGNIVASGGGNIISTNGTGISVTSTTKGATFGLERHTLSGGVSIIKTSGSGALIIQ